MSCLGCGVELTKRHQKVFCSNRCQRAMERGENVARWLATGIGAPGSGHGHYIRTYVLADQGEVCAICGGATTWNELPLRFVLDHVDGDSANNHRDNLRLICPNCDSQLPTFKPATGARGRAWRRPRYSEGKSY